MSVWDGVATVVDCLGMSRYAVNVSSDSSRGSASSSRQEGSGEMGRQKQWVLLASVLESCMARAAVCACKPR